MTFGEAIVSRYSKMGQSAHTHMRLLSAKKAMIHSSLPKSLKFKMANGYRSAEKQIFGHSTTLPGESELGVGGMNTTLGMRTQLKRAGMAEDTQVNEPSSSSSDLYQSLMSRLSGDNSSN